MTGDWDGALGSLDQPAEGVAQSAPRSWIVRASVSRVEGLAATPTILARSRRPET